MSSRGGRNDSIDCACGYTELRWVLPSPVDVWCRRRLQPDYWAHTVSSCVGRLAVALAVCLDLIDIAGGGSDDVMAAVVLATDYEQPLKCMRSEWTAVLSISRLFPSVTDRSTAEGPPRRPPEGLKTVRRCRKILPP